MSFPLPDPANCALALVDRQPGLASGVGSEGCQPG